MGKNAVCITQRAHGLALLELEVPIAQIISRTALSRTTLFGIQNRARQRGYDPQTNCIFQDHFFEDAPKSGRPSVMDDEKKGL